MPAKRLILLAAKGFQIADDAPFALCHKRQTSARKQTRKVDGAGLHAHPGAAMQPALSDTQILIAAIFDSTGRREALPTLDARTE